MRDWNEAKNFEMKIYGKNVSNNGNIWNRMQNCWEWNKLLYIFRHLPLPFLALFLYACTAACFCCHFSFEFIHIYILLIQFCDCADGNQKTVYCWVRGKRIEFADFFCFVSKVLFSQFLAFFPYLSNIVHWNTPTICIYRFRYHLLPLGFAHICTASFSKAYICVRVLTCMRERPFMWCKFTLIHMLAFSFDLNHFLLWRCVVVAPGKQSLNYYCQVLCARFHIHIHFSEKFDFKLMQIQPDFMQQFGAQTVGA